MDSIACKRYDVYWVKLVPARGSELRKTRPAVIVSLDVLNRAVETVAVCPLTSRLRPDWRTRVPVKVAGKSSEIAADQIRAISKDRLGKKLGSLSARDAAALRRLLGEMYADS
jgi:mRNA interferase MazF